MGNEVVRYKSGTKTLELTSSIVRQYLVAGNGTVTDQEVMMFMKMCEFQGLNPFLREAYLVKYGDDFPATMITGKETFVKRANRHPDYRGHKVGISKDGKEAWAEVYKKGFEFPIKVEVDYTEYVGMKSGKPNKMWSGKPKTMLKKVALCQALREAFPEEFGGMYTPEERNDVDVESLSTDEVIIDGQAGVVEYEAHGTKKAEAKSETKKEEAPKEKAKKPETPDDAKGEQITRISKVTKKEVAGKKTHYYIFSVADTMFSTFDKHVAAKADGIKGTEKEAMILYDIVEYNGKTYFNVTKGKADEVFILMD